MSSARRGRSGPIGELIASEFLTSRGVVVLSRNSRGDGGEIDLVVRDQGSVVAVEVKTATDGTDPLEAVDDRKMELLQRTAGALTVAVGRFDLVGVVLCPDGVVIRWLRGVD